MILRTLCCTPGSFRAGPASCLAADKTGHRRYDLRQRHAEAGQRRRVKGGALKVDVKEGVVTLERRGGDAAQKDKADQARQEGQGREEVVNNIVLKDQNGEMKLAASSPWFSCAPARRAGFLRYHSSRSWRTGSALPKARSGRARRLSALQRHARRPHLKWVPGKPVESFARTPTAPTATPSTRRAGCTPARPAHAASPARTRRAQSRCWPSKWEGKRLNAPNDIVVRKDGHVYFTDPAFGKQADTASWISTASITSRRKAR